MAEKLNLRCPECGSSNTTQWKGPYWICDSCDSEFINFESEDFKPASPLSRDDQELSPNRPAP